LRETIPSMISEISYMTNPFAAEGPAQSPPPTGPLPPIPTGTPQGRHTPLRPPGLNSSSDYSPTTTASFIMPPRNFVPKANEFFEETARLAQSLLPGSNPLRLSVYLEFCIFKWDCGKDFKTARKLASQAFQKALDDEEFITEADFADSREIMAFLQTIANRTEGSSRTSPKSQTTSVPIKTSPTHNQTTSPSSRNATRNPAHRKPVPKLDNGQNTPVVPRALLQIPISESGSDVRGTVPVDTPNSVFEEDQRTPPSDGTVRKSRTSHVTQQTSNASRKETNKEKKRRILEIAEEEIRRRDSVRSGGSAASRQATPPSMIRSSNKRSKDP